eukprot:s2991_g7.t2
MEAVVIFPAMASQRWRLSWRNHWLNEKQEIAEVAESHWRIDVRKEWSRTSSGSGPGVDPVTEMRTAQVELDEWLPPANRLCGSTVVGAILLWVLTIVCVVITTGSVVAVKECRDYCGLGCVAHGFPVACDGKAEACFVGCDRGFEEFDKEEELLGYGGGFGWGEIWDKQQQKGEYQNCIVSKKCEETAKDEQRIAQACEKEQSCDEKGFLGTGPRFVLMVAIVSILPVASTLCMGLYKEAFRWDDSVWEKMNFYDGFGRVVLVIGRGLGEVRGRRLCAPTVRQKDPLGMGWALWPFHVRLH